MLAASGVADPRAWLAEAEAEVLADLREHGPSTARDVGRRLPAVRQPLQLAPGKSYAATQGAHTRVLTILGFAGQVLRTRPSSWINGAYAYAAADDLAARRAGHRGPAYRRRPSWPDTGCGGSARPPRSTCSGGWAGPARTTRQALADCGAVAVEVASGPAWLAADDDDRPAAEPWVAVLPGLDPTTMGWKQRDWYLPPAAAESFDSIGNGGPTLWVDGRIVGAWAQTRDGEIHTHYFERVARDPAPGDRPPDRRGQAARRVPPGSPSGSPATSTTGCWAGR